jgi:carbon monoxide dehydrogenase subunit G
MQNAGATRLIAATQAELWSVLGNVATVDDWHPDVASAELLTPEPTGIGAARRCFFHDGTSVREEIVELDEGERVRMRLSEFDMPMRRMEAEFLLAPSSGTDTAVTFTVFYDMKMGILGSLLGATIVRRRLAKMADRVLAGLEHHVSTGEKVDGNFQA